MSKIKPASQTTLIELKNELKTKPQNRLGFLRDVAPRRLVLAVAVLAAGLAATLLASVYMKQEVETAARNEFEFICNEIQLNISDRLASHALVLYSGSALFYASEDVTRFEWSTFTGNLRIEQQMPGTQGIGFTVLIPQDQLEQHIQKIRDEGFPDYTITPEGERDIYTSIIYLEPFTWRNKRAFGYDMFSEPVRREAMERARDQNMAGLSGKVILVQETEEDVQSGTLMYVPVYRTGMPITTIEERRAAIQGWVYSPYRMKDLMLGTLGNYELRQGDRHIILQIYDGDQISEDTLLYDSRSDEVGLPQFSSADLTKSVQVNFFGEPWTLKFTQLGGLAAIADYGAFRMVLISGTSISLLLFVLIISLVRTAHYLESIRHLAETDALTGVYNRRKIIDLAESEFHRAKRQHHPLTILMTDLNFFKHINDNYGHIAGDHALRLTASAIQSTLRKDIDRVGRFGGDEFLIILPDIAYAQVENICTRLRTNVAVYTQNITSGIKEVSLSIGAAELSEIIQTLDELIEQADQAMYADKKQMK